MQQQPCIYQQICPAEYLNDFAPRNRYPGKHWDLKASPITVSSLLCMIVPLRHKTIWDPLPSLGTEVIYCNDYCATFVINQAQSKLPNGTG